MTIHFGTPKQIKKIADAVPHYGQREFESKTRSTVPMLDMLIHSRPIFDGIVRGMNFPKKCDMYLEYTVGPFGGRGNASHTDLMLIAGKDSLAIEAKWTESMYEKVSRWLSKGDEESDNRSKVLDGWLRKLGKKGATNFGEVVYQMVHRAASAVEAGQQNHKLAYFVFRSSGKQKEGAATAIERELDKLWRLLGSPTAFPFYVVEIEMTEQPAFSELPESKGTETDHAVRAALQGKEKLFSFKITKSPQKVGN
jgi:hypothetical protein